MINYANALTQKSINSRFLGALLWSPVVGLFSFMLWDYAFYGAESNVPNDAIAAFVFGWLILLGIAIPALVQCPAIVATEEGLLITSFAFIKFSLRWEDIVDIWTYPASSKLSERQGGRWKSHVRVKRGLTFLHRSLPRKEAGRWQWLRGFTFASAGVEYGELVRVIESHVGPQKNMSSFYKSEE